MKKGTGGRQSTYGTATRSIRDLFNNVKITLRELRQLVRTIIVEGGAPPTRAMFNYVTDPMSPDTNDREQLGMLADHPSDVDPDDDDELPDHLKEPLEDAEDCYGPVPPTAKEPYTQQDPLTRDTSVLPSPSIKR